MEKIKSVYIHIPFCNNICSYCDFCKLIYNSDWINPYLDKLNSEIENSYMGEELNTLYIGGGTPSSLSLDELKKLFSILAKFNKTSTTEFTFECNINDISEEKFKYLYNMGVNRLSIGIESFNKDKLEFMNRVANYKEVKNKMTLLRKIGFKNINLDLMYAIPNETIKVLKNDLKKFLKLRVEHISTYSLIIEKNTLVGLNKIKPIEEERDFKLYNVICKKLKKKGYIHYEVSNITALV